MPEAGNFIFKAYAPKVYGASPQNWVAIEDARGVMYFGNTDGLLEFDGVTWRTIKLPNGKAVRSLALSSQGSVYVGGQNELGYLVRDKTGAMSYRSLLNKLDPAERSFGDVWSIVETPAGMYFSTSQRLILYHEKSGVRIWKASGRLRRAFLIDGVLHVHILEKGLHRMDHEELVLAPGGAALGKEELRGVFKSSHGTTLLTSGNFFTYSDKGWAPIRFEVTDLAQNLVAYSVAQISGDLIAIGTRKGGLILADREGKLVRLLQKESGLTSDFVTGITLDSQGGTWLATNSGGILRFAARLTYFNESNGLRGTLISMARYKGVLYVGTSNGLFRLKGGTAGSAAAFEPVVEMVETVWSLQPHQDSLWIGTAAGLFEFNGKSMVAMTASKGVFYDVSFARKDPQTMFAAMRSASQVLRLEGKNWNLASEFKNPGEDFRTMADDENGIIWATTRSSIVRSDLSTNPPTVKTFNEESGLPQGWKSVFRAGGRVLFATEQGLVKYDAASSKFVKDNVFDGVFPGISAGVLLLREDERNGNVWLSGKDYHGVVLKPFSKDAEWRPMAFVGGGFEELWAIHPDTDGVIWAIGSDGRLGRLDPALGSARERGFELLVRKVLTSDKRRILHSGPSEKAIPIPPEQNSLRIEFAAPFFDAPERMEYQVELDEPLTESTPWSREAWKDLSNLWEGEHRLRFRARSPYGQTSTEASLYLNVKPPWYRTMWAYGAYGGVLGSLIWAVFRWRLKSLKESNRRLEKIVEERTTEIRQQRDQIVEQEKQTEALLLNILPAPVAAELRDRGTVAPMRFDDVTVCFTDFVGFTLSSEKISAEALVAKLHEYFTEFDKIIAKYGLEKLKTIGDSYMFVSGLPERSPRHAEMAVRAALEIVEVSRALGEKNPELNWRLRVGLHSGPVVAGVVGFKKFAFDIWGDTVNLASRMESSGAPNRVNLSERTYEVVKESIECEPRGLVKTKDGRDLPMYFAVSYRTTLEPSRAMTV